MLGHKRVAVKEGVCVIRNIVICTLHRLQGTYGTCIVASVVEWLACLPFDLRFAGLNLRRGEKVNRGPHAVIFYGM
jgi:hypothetical protein